MPSTIYGALGIEQYAADQVYLNTVGYDITYEAVQTWQNEYNMELDQALAAFVERTVEIHHLRYKLPAAGRMQRRGGQASSAAARASGSWDVGFPLEDFGDTISGDDIGLAYMTAAELQRHLDGVMNRNTGTVRFELLKCLFNNTERSFSDETLNTPTVLVEPLANGDTATYPPVAGSESATTRDRYIETGYAASAISDTNDPYATVASNLEPDFGLSQGGSNIAAFIHSDQVAKTRDLTDFVSITDMGVQPGADTATVVGAPQGLPGRIIGRMDGSGVWVVEWRWIPTGWLYAQHLDAPAPVIRRVDPAITGLGRGLQLVARESKNPFQSSFWRNRFGFGVGNRLNGLVIEFGTGGTYSIPTIYQ